MLVRINVVRDGQSVHEVSADELVLEIREPGIYRVEVIKKDLLWILSNPIRVTEEASSEA